MVNLCNFFQNKYSHLEERYGFPADHFRFQQVLPQLNRQKCTGVLMCPRRGYYFPENYSVVSYYGNTFCFYQWPQVRVVQNMSVIIHYE